MNCIICVLTNRTSQITEPLQTYENERLEAVAALVVFDPSVVT